MGHPATTGADYDAAEAILDALDRAASTDDIIALDAWFHDALRAGEARADPRSH